MKIHIASLLVVVVILTQTTAFAQSGKSSLKQRVDQTASKGIVFLLEKGRAENGSYSEQISPAVTALCISALVRNGIPVGHEKIQQSLLIPGKAGSQRWWNLRGETAHCEIMKPVSA